MNDDHNFLDDLLDISAKIVSAKNQAIEELVESIVTRIEGGMPLLSDMEGLGKRYIFWDGLEIWTWRGKPIVSVERLPDFVFRITELTEAQ